MAATYRDSTAAEQSDTSIEPSAPSILAGDVCLFVAFGYTSLAINSSGGFTLQEIGSGDTETTPFGGTGIGRAWWGVATVDNPTMPSFTQGIGDQWDCLVFVIFGADTTDPIDGGVGAGYAWASGQNSGSPVGSSIDPVVGTDGLLITCAHEWSQNGSGPLTVPTGMTQRENYSAGWDYGAAATEPLTSGASTGTRTFTGGNSADDWMTFTVAIKVASAPPSTSDTLGTEDGNELGTEDGNILGIEISIPPPSLPLVFYGPVRSPLRLG